LKVGTDINSFCLFCRTGSEKNIAQAIQQSYPEAIALAPVKLLPEKRQNIWTNREVVLLPGYVFVYLAGDLPADLRHKVRDLYKVLEYEYDERQLYGSDAEYADWVLRHSGRIEPSRVLKAGEEVQVVDGPLKDCNGRILRLDRHKRKAWVEFDFDGQKRVVSMGAEWIEAGDAEWVERPDWMIKEPLEMGLKNSTKS